MEIRQLRYFLEAASREHVTQAARALHITQSTLSHQLRQLEAELGTPLFDRVGRQVRLTDAGRLFSRFALKALRDLEDGQLALQSLNALQSGELRVGVITTYTNSLLSGAIASFARRYPGIHLHVEDLPMRQIEGKLQDGLLDLGLGFTTSDNCEELVNEPLFSERLMLLVRNDHPLAGRKAVRKKDLSVLDIALQSRLYFSRELIERHLSRHIRGRIRIELDSIPAMQNIVANSHLACMLFEGAVIASPAMRAIPITPHVTRTAALLWPRDRYRSEAAREFVTAIKANMPLAIAR
ncbi:LysR substrate-binding domain-containing protein [Achromobacter aloeverae]|nr:LysR substrate-binding domain-containing protein [Achromobacter aloeverae]